MFDVKLLKWYYYVPHLTLKMKINIIQIYTFVIGRQTDWMTFEDLLIFITGEDEVPTLGFPNKPSIDFYTQEAGVRRLPYASTCAMTLFLPRGITEEQELHSIQNQSVKDSLGFLKV